MKDLRDLKDLKIHNNQVEAQLCTARDEHAAALRASAPPFFFFFFFITLKPRVECYTRL